MESIGYLLVTCQLVIEQEIVLYQLMGIFFLDFQFEYSKLGTAVIHQLIDKMQQTIGISLDIFQLIACPAVAYLIDDFL